MGRADFHRLHRLVARRQSCNCYDQARRLEENPVEFMAIIPTWLAGWNYLTGFRTAFVYYLQECYDVGMPELAVETYQMTGDVPEYVRKFGSAVVGTIFNPPANFFQFQLALRGTDRQSDLWWGCRRDHITYANASGAFLRVKPLTWPHRIIPCYY